MENRPFKPTGEDKRRIPFRSQLIFGCYTGRAIAILIACVLIGWFIFLHGQR